MGAHELLADLAGAGLQVTAEYDRLVIRPAAKLTDPMRAALRAVKPELLALLHEDAARLDTFDLAARDRRTRLLRWGWSEPEAAALAARLAKRDRDADARVSCADCRHYRPGRCGNHRRAGLQGPEVGRDLASMLQRCAGFDPRTRA